MIPPPPDSWDRAGLELRGFVGFIPLVGLDPQSLPQTRGMYAVLRDPRIDVAFVASSPVARRRPHPAMQLQSKMERLNDQPIVYLGKADPSDGLRGRLGAFSRKSSAHTGGRALWQLADVATLLTAWRETPDHPSAEMETQWLVAFRTEHGDYPFANWRR